MVATLLGSGRTSRELNSLNAPTNVGLADIGSGVGGAFGPTAAPFAISDAADAGGSQGSLVDPGAEHASATNLFTSHLMDGISAVMDQAHSEDSTNFIELGNSLRATLDGHLETALGAARDNHVVPTSFIEGLKRQGAAAVQNVAGATGQVLARRRREQHVASINALIDSLIQTVKNNPGKLPVALARLETGVNIARDAVLSTEEADRKHTDGKRALNIAAFTQLAETKPDTVIEAASRGGLSALAEEDAAAVLNIAKQARAREAAQAKARREVEAATKRATFLLAGKSAKAFDPADPKDVELVVAVHGSRLESTLNAKHADPRTRQEAARMEARFAAKTGVLVPKVAARIEAGLAGKDAKQLANAALIYSAIAGSSPKLVPCVAGDAQCLKAMRVASAVKAGNTDAEAMEIADTEVAKASPETIKARLAAYRQDRITTEAGNAAFLEGKLAAAASEGNGQATPGTDQNAGFNALVERYYGATGDLVSARATALFVKQRGVTLEGGVQGGGEGKFQTIGAGGGDGKTLDPNATLGHGGEKQGKSGGKDTKAEKERFAEARAVVEGKAGRFLTGLARKELKSILGELEAAKGNAEKTAEAMGKLRALVGKHRRNIDALGEGLEEGITEEGKRIIAALEKAEAEGGDVHARTLEILAGTTVETERKELVRLDRIGDGMVGPGGVGADTDETQKHFKLSEMELAIIAELPVFRNAVGIVAGAKITADAVKAFVEGKHGEAAKLSMLAALAAVTGGRIGRAIARRAKRSKGATGSNVPKPPRQLKPKNSEKDFARHPRLNTPRHKVDINGMPLPKVENKTNFWARRWYNKQIGRAKSKLDKSTSLLEQSKWASNQRNIIRTQGRALMKNQKKAEGFRRDRPNLTWKQLYDRHKKNGLTNEQAYRSIIESSFRSNREVNREVLKRAFGLKR